jgi:hypothetical protein
MLDKLPKQTVHLEVLKAPKEGALSRTYSGELVFDPGGDFADMACGETRAVSFDYRRTGIEDSAVGTATVVVRAEASGPIVDGIKFTDRRTVSLRIPFGSTRSDGSQVQCKITRAPQDGKVTSERNGDIIFYPGNDFDDLINGETRLVSLECQFLGAGAVRDYVIELCIQASLNGLAIFNSKVREKICERRFDNSN